MKTITTALTLLVTLVVGASAQSIPGGGGKKYWPQPTFREYQDVETPASRDTDEDRDLTTRITRSISKDKSLSEPAQHIKVKTVDGVVYLIGIVSSKAEQAAVIAKAADVVGKQNVRSRLTIRGD